MVEREHNQAANDDGMVSLSLPPETCLAVRVDCGDDFEQEGTHFLVSLTRVRGQES